MSTFFRALAFLVAVCCLTWVGVLWWWQSSGHSAEVADLVLYLGVLPLAIALVLLALRWVWQRAAARQAAALLVPASGAAGGAAEPTAAGPGAEEQARHAVVQLVLASVQTVVGDQPGDLLDAAAAGKPLPQPDKELQDDDGLPVMCARLPDAALELDAVRTDLQTLLPAVQQRLDHANSLSGDHVLRALAALQPVLRAQRDALLALHEAQRAALEDGGAAISRLPPAQRPPLPGLRVLLGWPPHWSAVDQALGHAWVQHLLQSPEADLATAHAITYNSLAGTGEELWLRVDQHSHGATPSPWLLVAACDSDVAPERVDALVSAGRLYHAAAQPGGCMPGEAAAALLLAPAGWTAPPDADLQPVRLHRPALLRRDKPVETGGRVGHRELAQALEQSLVAAQVGAADLGQLVCDADQHSPRGTELYGMAVEALHHLDPVEDMRLLGRITGRTGAASALLVLVAAAEAARSARKTTLAIGMADSQLRMVLVVQPPKEADAAAA